MNNNRPCGCAKPAITQEPACGCTNPVMYQEPARGCANPSRSHPGCGCNGSMGPAANPCGCNPMQVIECSKGASIPCCTAPSCVDSMPLSMAYVPMQKWQYVVNACEGLRHGTIFKELVLPFNCTRCNAGRRCD